MNVKELIRELKKERPNAEVMVEVPKSFKHIENHPSTATHIEEITDWGSECSVFIMIDNRR